MNGLAFVHQYQHMSNYTAPYWDPVAREEVQVHIYNTSVYYLYV